MHSDAPTRTPPASPTHAERPTGDLPTRHLTTRQLQALLLNVSGGEAAAGAGASRPELLERLAAAGCTSVTEEERAKLGGVARRLVKQSLSD